MAEDIFLSFLILSASVTEEPAASWAAVAAALRPERLPTGW